MTRSGTAAELKFADGSEAAETDLDGDRMLIPSLLVRRKRTFEVGTYCTVVTGVTRIGIPDSARTFHLRTLIRSPPTCAGDGRPPCSGLSGQVH